MTFLHGWAIGIGVVALAAPLAVHLLTKPRPISYPLSTLRFLREVIEQRRSRSRLRDWLLLLLRMLAVGLLAMAVARPLFEKAPTVAEQAAGQTSRVIILDVSQSMGAGVAGGTAVQRAQATALRYLDYTPGMEADVILAGARPRSVFERLSPNLASLRESIRQAQPRAERTDVPAAIEEAGRLLANASTTDLELVVVSDFQRNGWGSMNLDGLPKDTRVQFESVAGRDTDNVAITAIRFPSQIVVGQDCRCEIEVSNFSDSPQSVRCQLDVGGLQQTLEGDVTAMGSTTLSTVLNFSDVGWKTGWAQLLSRIDALAQDDRRPIALEVHAPPKLLLISRQSEQHKPSSSFYIQQAMQIVTADTSESSATNQAVSRLHPQRVSAGTWPDADLIVLDHPGALDVAALQILANRVRRGRGLLYVASELVDAVNIQQLSDLAGKGFQPPVQLIPPTAGEIRKDLFVNRLRSRESPFRIFGDEGAAALQGVRFGGGLNTRTLAEGLRDQVLAELNDSSALLYVSAYDAGQIALLNANLELSNWCVQPSFLPIFAELIQTLLSGRLQAPDAVCGEPMIRLLPTNIASDATLVSGPADEFSPNSASYGKWEWSAEQGSLLWSWPDPAGAGAYQLKREGTTVVAVATSAPPSESDLRSLDREVLQGRLSSGRDIGFRDSQDLEKSVDYFWNWLIVACVIGLTSEVIALRWFQ